VAQATNINASPVSLSPDGHILRLAMNDAPPQPLLFASNGAVARYGVAIVCVGGPWLRENFSIHCSVRKIPTLRPLPL